MNRLFFLCVACCLFFSSGCNSLFRSKAVSERVWSLDTDTIVKVRCEREVDYLKPAQQRSRGVSFVSVESRDGLASEIQFDAETNNGACLFDLESMKICTDSHRRIIWLIGPDGQPLDEYIFIRAESQTGIPQNAPVPHYDPATAVILEPVS